MRAVDTLTLAAVGLVVLLVSLPRLRDLALRENEADAAWLVTRLADACGQSEAHEVQALIRGVPALDRQVDDAEFLEGGRLLRRHGYLFEVVQLEPLELEVGAGSTGSDPVAAHAPRAIRAWPWQAGRTGRMALVWTAASGVVGDPNPGGRWSGQAPPDPESAVAEAWRPVRAH